MNPFVLLVVLAQAAPASAQLDALLPRPVPFDGRLSVTASSLGEQVVHPGGQVGVEYTLARAASFSLLVGLNLGAYTHYRYATGLYADVALGARFVGPTGILLELLADAGYLHVFPYGAVYEVPASGAPVQVPNTGRPAFRFGGTAGVGLDFSKTSLAQPLAVTLRLGAFGEAQFSTVVQAHPQVMVCLSWTLH